jgi:hypothetical protein
LENDDRLPGLPAILFKEVKSLGFSLIMSLGESHSIDARVIAARA